MPIRPVTVVFKHRHKINETSGTCQSVITERHLSTLCLNLNAFGMNKNWKLKLNAFHSISGF